MKRLTLLIAIALFSIQSFSAEVKSAKLDFYGRNILVDIVYRGGCNKHIFKIVFRGCLDSRPRQCVADLIENTKDLCGELKSKTIEFSLINNGFDYANFHRAFLTIVGENQSRADLQLP